MVYRDQFFAIECSDTLITAEDKKVKFGRNDANGDGITHERLRKSRQV